MVRFLLILVLVLAVLVLIGFVMGYNKIRSADVRVAESLSGIDVERFQPRPPRGASGHDRI